MDTFLSSSFVFIYRLSLLSLSLYYRTELVSNGKNVCCSSIQSQRNWICIVSYPRQRNSFLTVRSVQESLGSTESASTTLASEGRIWEISEPSKTRLRNDITESEKKKLIERCLKEQLTNNGNERLAGIIATFGTTTTNVLINSMEGRKAGKFEIGIPVESPQLC